MLDAYESETTESLTSIERQRGEDQERLLTTYRQQVDSLERQLQEAASSGKVPAARTRSTRSTRCGVVFGGLVRCGDVSEGRTAVPFRSTPLSARRLG